MKFDLTAPVVPGKSAAGVRLGQSINSVLQSNNPSEIEDRGETTVYRFAEVSMFVSDGLIDQIGVHEGYSGAMSGVAIGSQLADVYRVIGTVREDDDDNLVVDGLKGWCFETTEFVPPFSEPIDNQNAIVKDMFVFMVRQR